MYVKSESSVITNVHSSVSREWKELKLYVSTYFIATSLFYKHGNKFVWRNHEQYHLE